MRANDLDFSFVFKLPVVDIRKEIPSITHTTEVSTAVRICPSHSMAVVCIELSPSLKTKNLNHLKQWYVLHFQCLLLDGQAPVSGHYKSIGRLTPFSRSEGVRLQELPLYSEYCIVTAKKVRNFWLFAIC